MYVEFLQNYMRRIVTKTDTFSINKNKVDRPSLNWKKNYDKIDTGKNAHVTGPSVGQHGFYLSCVRFSQPIAYSYYPCFVMPMVLWSAVLHPPLRPLVALVMYTRLPAENLHCSTYILENRNFLIVIII